MLKLCHKHQKNKISLNIMEHMIKITYSFNEEAIEMKAWHYTLGSNYIKKQHA